MIELKWLAIERDIDRRTWAVGQVHIEDMEKRDEVQIDDLPTSKLSVMRWTEEGVALLRTLLKRKFVEPAAGLSDDLDGTDKLDVDVEGWLFEENARHTGVNMGEGIGNGEPIVGEWGGTGLMIEDSTPVPSEGVISERTWAMLMHRFVVTYVMWQWCHLFFPDWEGRYQKQYQQVKGTLTRHAWNIAMPVKHKRPKMMDVESVVLEEGLE